jgi:co-chaperonin GroES (HSP10)
MEKIIIPMNDFVLVERITETVTQNDFVVPDEAKGDGIILKCKTLSGLQNGQDVLKKGTIVYVPEYSLRQIEGMIMACSSKSVIAFEYVKEETPIKDPKQNPLLKALEK